MLNTEYHEENMQNEENDTNDWYQKFRNTRRTNLLFIAAVVIILTIYSFFSGGTGSITCEVNDELLGVAGFDSTSIFIPLDDISSVQLLDSFSPGTLLTGTSSDQGWCGSFSNDQYSQYTLYATTRSDFYIEVRYADGILVFNTGSSSRTQSVYDELIQHLQERQEK